MSYVLCVHGVCVAWVFCVWSVCKVYVLCFSGVCIVYDCECLDYVFVCGICVYGKGICVE